MLKKLLAAAAVTIGFASASAAEPFFSIGAATVSPPSGWREVKKEEERIVFRSPDDRQQATVSLMRFGVAPSLEDFTRLCALRLQAEKKGSPEAFIEPEAPEPFTQQGRYALLYSGGDKKSARTFSCYLSCGKTELITIYVEAIGSGSKDHLASFQSLVASLKQK